MSIERESHQNEFLDKIIEEKAQVSVFLINGIRLGGQILAYDRHVLQVSSYSGVQVVYKHAVSTVLPNVPEAAPRRSDIQRERTASYPRRPVAAY